MQIPLSCCCGKVGCASLCLAWVLAKRMFAKSWLWLSHHRGTAHRRLHSGTWDLSVIICHLLVLAVLRPPSRSTRACRCGRGFALAPFPCINTSRFHLPVRRKLAAFRGGVVVKFSSPSVFRGQQPRPALSVVRFRYFSGILLSRDLYFLLHSHSRPVARWVGIQYQLLLGE